MDNFDENFSSKLYAAGKSAAVLKESHFELAQSYRTALRNERRLRKTVTSMKDEVDSLKAQLQTVWTKVAARPVDAWVDSSSHAALPLTVSRSVAVFEERLHELQRTRDTLTDRVQFLERELDRVKLKAERDRDDSARSIADAQTETEATRTRYQQSAVEISRLRAELEARTSELSKEKAESFRAIAAAAKAHDDEMRDLRTKVASATSTGVPIDERIAVLQVQVSAAVARAAQAEKETEDMKSTTYVQVEKLSRDMRALERGKQDAEATVRRLEREISRLTTELDAAQAEAQRREEAAEATIDDLRTQLHAAEKEGSLLRAANKRLETSSQQYRDKTVATLEQELATLRDKCARLEEDHSGEVEKLQASWKAEVERARTASQAAADRQLELVRSQLAAAEGRILRLQEDL